MPRYEFKARDPSGKTVASAIEAPSRKEAIRLLSTRGLSVTSVSDPASSPDATAKASSRRKAPSQAPAFEAAAGQRGEIAPRRAERLPFLESLHELTSSGLSAGEAVRLLSVRIKEPRQRMLAEGLWTRLSEGAPLSRAMAAYPLVFDTSTVNLIHAGEATGSLNDTLARLIEHLVEQREMRRALVAAMAYPIMG
jgi:type II secretory pathway component PulF